ncbi:hypothetical protein Btru_034807 [Bulinus truncatus]|nr:hypothetical protein Btru_034807 [Bulinus truncatus]
MFRRKGDETFDHINIKRGITNHFAKTLKILQQKHLQSDSAEFIYSNDASNNLCNALEAVFLHGLKDSVAQKLTAYVGLSVTLPETASGQNFWNVAAKFTHNDVVAQMQSLSQINTQIGWCRAWVRLALNDGLMQSYLHSMIVDVKTLKYFYHSYAYLRDFEQPGILKNLLTGLMSLEFKLSYNSSVLNTWNNTTLQIAGLLDSHLAPSPSVALPCTEDNMTSINAIQSFGQHQIIHTGSWKETEKASTSSIATCNIDDSYLSRSEESTCSHISCPDPGTLSNQLVSQSNTNLSPAILPWLASENNPTGYDEMKKKSLVTCESDKFIARSLVDNTTSELNKTSVGKDMMAPIRPRSKNIDNDLRYQRTTMKPDLDVYKQSFSSDKKNAELDICPLMNSEHVTSHLSVKEEIPFSPNQSSESENKLKVRNYEEICATLPPVKLDAAVQEEILRKVLQEFDIQADKKRESEQSKLGPTELMSWVSDNITIQLKSSHLVSDEVACDQNIMCGEREEERGTKAEEINVCEESANFELSASSHYGNSLSGMSGWSSEFEPNKNIDLTKSTVSNRSKNQGESFASVLQKYTSEQQNKVITLDQIIGTLYHPTDEEENIVDNENSSYHSSNCLEEHQHDSCLDDFEVLQSPDSFASSAVSTSSSKMLYLFQIPREHGLSHQNFTCHGCLRPIGLIYGQPHLCEFDGCLYCSECYEAYDAYIPSSIIFNWDFRKKKVCKENFKFLQDLEDHPLYDLELLNPKLYSHLPELKELKALRQQLCYLKSYLFTCSQKMAESLRQKVWPREHLYDRQDLYSVTDLLQVQSCILHKLVKDLVKFASSHVYDCLLCSQKGFVCEICRNPKAIFPFEMETTIRCNRCKSVYHKTCMTESLPCPKCERWGKRQSKINVTEEHPEDYGISPTL